MIDLFYLNKNYEQLAFFIGNEMLSTLKSSNLTTTTNNNQLLQQQNQTEIAIQKMIQSLKQKGYDSIDKIESMLNEKLKFLRSKCYHQLRLNQSEPNQDSNRSSSTIEMMIDCIRTYEKFFNNLDMILLFYPNINYNYNQHQNNQNQTDFIINQQQQQTITDRFTSKLSTTDFSLRNMPYKLFIHGIINRFISLGYGQLIITIMNNNYNYNYNQLEQQQQQNQSINISDYFYYYYTSKQQIESAFIWNQRFYQKFLELEQSEYQTELLINRFNHWFSSIQQQYLQISQLMIRMFQQETLDRINSYLKKKNAESIERLMLINGTNRTKFIQDQDANNQITIQMDSDFIETFGLQRIQYLINMAKQQQQQSINIEQKNSIDKQYEQLQKDQIRFLIRLQDFLNISMNTHLIQTLIQEQTNFIYYLIIVLILIISVISGLLLYICNCISSPKNHHNRCCCCSNHSQTKSIFNNNNRRWLFGRRRLFWNLSTSTTTFKTYFSSTANNHQQQQQQNRIATNNHCCCCCCCNHSVQIQNKVQVIQIHYQL
uniref:Uncharacterized protein LOC113796664 n=1 Tax=Dermatophagoides pteronyssinus TaxID=6956 RepID=A0A6P6YDI9_DERPT|nr:uncharacterized protein LOC113796664 [Dermatophagoides pteronyssinus]